jgi:uncharacterized membrane protein required for colicin V production
MNWVDVIAIIILILGLIGGVREGAIKGIFSLASLLIAIPCAGLSYSYIAALLSFLPGTDWENFLGFFIALGIISALLHLIFLVPRKIGQKIWDQGVFFRLLGAVFNLLAAGIGLTVFMLVLTAYPIFDWLVDATSGSSILRGLVLAFGFIQLMLPEALRKASEIVAIITL